MRISCPFCSERAITRSSKRPSPAFYEVYAQCQNPSCGWSGKLTVEFVSTTAPSRAPATDVRIPLDPASRDILLAQLQR